ncbi:unnamed protein product [Brachionus calyciflorus]|uniref:C-type lectin domain-containing protein n=1 Tax=Brachionus calyciflorus TaxID=104777 RepID=A0A813X692_9BILA|nr:unnamed protein product [Brachionus calyciflorus]
MLINLVFNSESFIRKYPNLFIQFIQVLFFQLNEIPEDFFTDIITSNNFLVVNLHNFFDNIKSLVDECIDDANEDYLKLNEKCAKFKNYLQEKFDFDFEQEPDEYAPVVCEDIIYQKIINDVLGENCSNNSVYWSLRTNSCLSCKTGFMKYSDMPNFCYRIESRWENFDDSKIYCESLGAFLFRPKTQKEREFFANTFFNSYVFVDSRITSVRQTYKWPDGSYVCGFDNFQPDNLLTLSESVLEIRANGKFNDLSNVGHEILENAKEYHIDGTFKFCPSIFKQFASIHAVFKNYVLPCAYIFLESKDANTYIESLKQIRNNAFNRNLERVLSDFEITFLIRINTVFKDVEIKGCWFHYCQAIKRNLFSLGLKKRFVNDWNFRFWIRRILVLPLIQVEYLERAFKIIVKELPSNDPNFLEFIRYFITQWLSGQMSPNVWYHHRSKKSRTNNDLERFHSRIHKTDLRPHPNIDDVIRYLKAFDCRMRDTYLTLIKIMNKFSNLTIQMKIN